MRYVGERFANALSIVCRIVVFASLTGLSSCVQPTVFPRYLTVADVINNIKCELYLAILETPDSGWFDDWASKFRPPLRPEPGKSINSRGVLLAPRSFGI